MRSNLNIHKTIPPNHKFGWLFATIFAGSFIYFYWKHYLGLAIISIALSAFFVVVTIFTPLILAPLNRAWFALSIFLGKVVNPIVLSIIFFVMIVPASLIGRLLGRDALLLKKRQGSSYWVDKEPIKPESFKNQF